MNGFPERFQAFHHLESDIAGADNGDSSGILKSFIELERILKINDRENVFEVGPRNTGELRSHACRYKQPLIGKLRMFAGVGPRGHHSLSRK